MNLAVRVLDSHDAGAFQQLRLEGLRRDPIAFAAHYEEEASTDISAIATRIAPAADRVVVGAFEGGVLVGIAGLEREARRNTRHKALLWGMYVAPGFRGMGLGRHLLNYALDKAAEMHGLRQVNLWVNATAASAVRLYRAAGFDEVGTERAFLMVDGLSQDLTLMVHVLQGRRDEESAYQPR